MHSLCTYFKTVISKKKKERLLSDFNFPFLDGLFLFFGKIQLAGISSKPIVSLFVPFVNLDHPFLPTQIKDPNISGYKPLKSLCPLQNCHPCYRFKGMELVHKFSLFSTRLQSNLQTWMSVILSGI